MAGARFSFYANSSVFKMRGKHLANNLSVVGNIDDMYFMETRRCVKV
jgi:hypothetical protein